MKTILARLTPAFFAVAFTSQPVAAADDSFTAQLCGKDSAACRELALEVARLDLLERVAESLPKRLPGDLLCPEDNPDCCPPERMPVCSELEDALIESARLQVGGDQPGGECPFSPAICESLGSFYCGPDEVYLPWSGCTGRIVVEPPYCPPGFKRGPSGLCLPVVCPPGKRPNSKGICIDQPCYSGRLGIVVPCSVLADPSAEQLYIAEPVPGTEQPIEAPSRLVRYLEDRRVQQEAAQRLRRDLETALDALDEIAPER